MVLNSSFAISIPAYNNEQTIEQVINESIDVLSKITDDYEIVVINDGSIDNTKKIIDNLANRNKNIRVINHEKNEGFGKTIKEVFTEPKKEWVFFVPGDGQISPYELFKLYIKIKDYDFIIGRRKNRRDSLIRKINSFIYNLIISLLSNKRVNDVDSVVLFRRSILNNVKLEARSAFIHAEIYLNVVKKDISITEIEIEHKSRLYGKQGGNKISVIISTIVDIIKYLIRGN
jgi:dolichol-phosphate mannosyltransferase